MKKAKEIKKIKETKKVRGIMKTGKVKNKIFLFFSFFSLSPSFSSFSSFLSRLCFLPFLAFILLLSGCTGMGSKFDCNVSSGGGCFSMKQVNRMANYGAFNGGYIYKNGKRYRRNDVKQQWYQKNKGNNGDRKNKKNGYPLDAFEGSPIRSNESIQQIWVGPYEDTNGSYHEPSYLYTVIKKGGWLGEPASVIQD